MIRLVIVEDEWILRAGLIHSIDWASLDCVVAGEAGNGKEGLELILKERPDIVIADIRMPLMDGLEMISAASDTYRFWSILLTSYSEFEYARQAITLGVSKYLLKPVNEKTLYETLEQLTEDIKRERLLDKLLQRVQDTGVSVDDENLQVHMVKDDPCNYYVEAALNEIYENYTRKISLESIADRLEVSSSYLTRKFRETTRHSFLDYLNQYRVIKAIQLMGTGKYRFGEIAELVGFSSEKHFYGVFRKYTHMTPSEFIKEKVSIVMTDLDIKEK
ncbi:response regulator [Clostridium sp. MCC353]|uniref:response regulator transcription factor n=1 Tax=Clostridium sp. MCC353 TaxID=2592646 RepID=UPI001C034CE2|nr:response regulator [Clostridium sp. MCC353]MBT9777026.1 response regulator [Clostridium sp. MCC353]